MTIAAEYEREISRLQIRVEQLQAVLHDVRPMVPRLFQEQIDEALVPHYELDKAPETKAAA